MKTGVVEILTEHTWRPPCS